ncbi:MAG: hypothetical protein LBI53_04045 [Candidatus Peribacteria bacterium]|jgi:hypothetical protein|nr:hypothetical protein [Candidatus Peribacteria bacterium]
MLYPLFDFNDGVIHAGYGIFDPCKITVSDPRIDSPAPIRKTSCNFIYLRHTNQSLISGYIVDNKNSLTILKRYNREARVLETIGSLDMLFILDDVQSEYLIGKKYPCLDCDV